MIKEEDRYSGPIYVWDSTTFWKRKNEQEEKPKERSQSFKKDSYLYDLYDASLERKHGMSRRQMEH